MTLQTPRIAALLLFCCMFAAGQSFTITTPSDGAVISGNFIFSVAVVGANTASVEYRVGSLSLGIAVVSPFRIGWNTGYAADGDYSITAIAYDSTGNILGTADRRFSINNRRGALHIDSPDLSKPLSGTVTLAGTATDVLYYPAEWNFSIDGSNVAWIITDNSGQHTVSGHASFDTTRFTNGRHELHIEVQSDIWPPEKREDKSWYPDRAGMGRVVTIDNGHTQMGIAANYEHVYLKPGQVVTLSCRLLYTDSTAGACAAPSYSSSDAKVAAVASSGVLTAGLTDGFSTVSLSANGYSTKVYVWVEKHPTIAHFSGSGQLLTSYQPGASIFLVAPFSLEPSEVKEPSLNQEVKRAGINTLFSGFYSNPRNLSTTYQAWKTEYDRSLGASWSWAAANGYHLYTMGDELVRGIGTEGWWTMNWPYAQQAAQYAMQSLAGSGIAIGIDIIDEGSMMWGATPTPPRKIGEAGMFTSITCSGSRCAVSWPSNPVKPGRFFAGRQFALTGSTNLNLNTPLGQMFTAQNITDNSFEFVPAGNVTGVFTASNDPDLEFLRWAGAAGGCPNAPCTPPVPNTALSTVAGWLRSAPVHVPISWPALGIHPPIVHDQWAGKDSQVSDYFPHYWDTYLPGRTYTWTSGIEERTFWMRSAFYSRQPYARLDRPQIILATSNSFSYVKNAPGEAFYNPVSDTLTSPSTSASTVSAEMMTAAALGNAGVRFYHFEPPQGEQGRVNGKLGVEYQTGMSPVATERNSQEIWRSVGYVTNLLTKTLQPFILGTPVSSPALVDNIITAARQSESGMLLMVINGNDWERTVAIDLTPYRTGLPITKYRVRGKGIESGVMPDSGVDRVAMGEGETVVYLFPRSRAASWISSIPIPAPVLPPGAKQAILHHGYIYSQDIDYQTAGMVCTEGCTVDVDTALGAVVYQFVFTDARGSVLGRSVTRTISDPGRVLERSSPLKP